MRPGASATGPLIRKGTWTGGGPHALRLRIRTVTPVARSRIPGLDCLERGETPGARRAQGERLIDSRDLIFAELECPGTGVLFDVLDARGFGDREAEGVADKKRQ